jgi:ComF family protein
MPMPMPQRGSDSPAAPLGGPGTEPEFAALATLATPAVGSTRTWSTRLAAAARRALAPDCIICGTQRADPVCGPCYRDYLAADTARCRVCANLLPPVAACTATAPNAALALCGRCIAHPPRFDATIALGDYRLPLDGIVLALKFHARLDLGMALGRLLAQRAAASVVEGADAADSADAIIALPLGPARLRERGYNQSEEIARSAAAALGLPLLRRALVRVREGPAQQTLALAQRRANVRGAFAVAQPPRARHVLLVDDVLTTGSTLDEAASCLKRAGVQRVTNLVAARTP